MKELLERMAQAIVDNPEQVSVKEVEGDQTIVFEIQVAKEDIGKIIGKHGKNIDAMRKILSAASAKEKKRCVLELTEKTRYETPVTPPENLSRDRHKKISENQKGIVTWFDNKKGYGFITMDDGAELFVHHTGIRGAGFKALAEGDRATFDVVESDRGLKAINVVKL
jgi:predicted RNA-binding protein YlqC (UPF0109 family)/cold shock CspA family protein